MNLTQEIKEYYEKRELKHPNIWQALGWVAAELGEVYEQLMAREGGWVRNNPENHEEQFSKDRLAEELGDVIFMLIVAGIEEGVDPVEAIRDKMQRKLTKVATGVSRLEEAEEPEEDTYDYAQDDMNFDAERERRMR